MFTTVSEITAHEAETLLGRAPDPITPNGIDLDADRGARAGRDPGGRGAQAARSRVHASARTPCPDPQLLCISGRYEFHNKGIDLLLEALALLKTRPGRPLAAYILVPAANSGPRPEVLERLASGQGGPPLGVTTHNLLVPEQDPVLEACQRLGLDNAPESRVKVIHAPVYLDGSDRLLPLRYEAALRGFDLTCFPSFYEPWGYTPQESLALGVPTITADQAGFGAWLSAEGAADGRDVVVLERRRDDPLREAEALADAIERMLADPRSREERAESCRRIVERCSWERLIGAYERAFEAARESANQRTAVSRVVPYHPLPPLPVAPHPVSPRLHLVAFQVEVTLPEALRPLERIAHNYSWSWNAEAVELFERLDPGLWRSSRHNPIAMLRNVSAETLRVRAADPDFLTRLQRVEGEIESYLRPALAGAGRELPFDERSPVAYLCAEFGVHESLRIYSGGLGVLAGDHLKSASDLRIPLVAVGLFYRKGYFQQEITDSGEQTVHEARNDPGVLPLQPVVDASGHPIRVSLPLPASTLWVGAWKADVGRLPLYLLDSDLPENRPEDREITQTLYPSDPERRLQQEIVLGMGGEHLLHALGLSPSVFHLNEGHAAFVSVARVARLLSEEGLTFPEAREVVRASTVFTTHTPVPAGHDRFEEDLIRRHFSHAPALVGLPWDRFIALGRPEGDDHFNMTYLALRFSSYVNGVSAMHGRVSRHLLRAAWPSLLENEVPVDSISNGVHLPTWTGPGMARLLGAVQRPVRASDFRDAAHQLPNEELWAVRCQARRNLLDAVRGSVEARMREHHESPARIDRMLNGLEDHALLLGFARRFAAYKRADLLFRDPERLARLLNDPERPVRLFIAGKGHPADGLAADVLRRVVHAAQSEPLLGRVFVLANYEMDLALHLVRGADVWLNTPARGLEASGTSGMKAAANGGLNVSVLDGWWLEGYDGANGWTIGDHGLHSEPAIQDEMDALHLYHLLEDEIVPEFFDRNADGIPERWLERVRTSLSSIPPAFDSDRMLTEYLQRAYLDRGRDHAELRRRRFAEARERARRHQRLARAFGTLRIEEVDVSPLNALRVGDTLAAAVTVELGQLATSDVVVELVVGDGVDGGLANPVSARLEPVSEPVGGRVLYRGTQVLRRSGTLAYGVRVRAADPEHGLQEFVLWA